MNKVILVGNLGGDPEQKLTTSGKAVTSFTLATQGMGKDAPADWHKVEAWDKTAEFISKYFSKGSKMVLEGRIKYETYEKDGEKKYVTKIVADRVEFGGGDKKADQGTSNDEAMTAAGF